MLKSIPKNLFDCFKFRKLSFIFFVNIVLLSGWIFFLISCHSSLFYSADNDYWKNIKNAPYDVIIVPGFPYEGNHWNNVIKMRVLWSKYLYDKGYTKNIIFSGTAVYSPYVESKVFAAYSEALGVPANNIFTEEKAEHSTENVYYSYVLAKQKGFKKVALATDSYQIRSLRPFILKFEIPVVFLPIIFDTLSTLNDTEPIVDLKNAMVDHFVPLQERQGLFSRIEGTLGKHIVWHKDDLKKKKYQR